MSTVISQESVRELKGSSQHQGVTSHQSEVVRLKSPVLRLLGWYRQAVMKPVSDEEKAEWQEISF